MENEIQIDNMCKLWGTPKDDQREILFDRSLRSIGDHPIIIFQEWRTNDYFFLTFRSQYEDRTQYRGEISIKGEVGNKFDKDAFLDTTHIHWASQEVFETLFKNKEVQYITDIFSDENSLLIYKNILNNLNEIPPFVSLMKIELNQNQEIVHEVVYSNEKLLKMSCDYNEYLNPKNKDKMKEHQKQIKVKNSLNINKIKQLDSIVYDKAFQKLRSIQQKNPNFISETREKEFPNVKNKELISNLEKGKEIDKSLNSNYGDYDYFSQFTPKEKSFWLEKNYGKAWESDYQLYKGYKKHQLELRIKKRNTIQKSEHKTLSKKQSSGEVKM